MMATTTATIKKDYPLPVYNYRVNIGAETIAFSEVSGLSIGYETTTYKESYIDGAVGGVKVFRMPGQVTTPTLTLKKGIVPEKSKKAFYAWINGIALNQVEKKDISISLCDETGKAVVTWMVIDAFPTKLDAPTFDANSNDIAIESMELMADGVKIQ